MRTTAVESFIRRPAQTLARDPARNRVVTVRTCDGGVGAVAYARFAGIDDRRVCKTDGHVVSRRSVLLEEAGLADSGERIVGLLAVQSVGLEPLFPSGNSVGTGTSNHAPSSCHQIVNHGLAGQRGRGHTIGFELRAGHNHAGFARLRWIWNLLGGVVWEIRVLDHALPRMH